jgi:hypothetical protein
MAAAIAPEHCAKLGKCHCQSVHMKVGNRMRHIHAASVAGADGVEGSHTWYDKTKPLSHMYLWRGDTADETAHNVWNNALWH